MPVAERVERLSWNPPGDLGWLFVLLALAAIAYAIFVYRRTDAPLSRGTRGTLVALRAGFLLVLLAILCRPVLSLALPGGAERGVLMLLDRSLSMSLPGAAAGDTRDAELARVRATLEPKLRGRFPLTVEAFAMRPYRDLGADDPLPAADGDGTDLAAALEQGLTAGGPATRPGAVVLVTDGVSTAGPDPVPAARRLGVPVTAVALGSDRPVRDLTLVRVRANHDAFLNEKTPIEAVVRLQDPESRDVDVTLLDVTDAPEELARERVTLDGNGAERRVPLTFEPRAAGLRFLEARVSPVSGEATTANNRRLVAVQVREQKTGVLLLTGALTWDHTFIRRAVEADSSLEVTAAIWKGQGFVNTATREAIPALTAERLRDWSVLVLDRVAPAQLGSRAVEALDGFVRGGGGLVIVAGGEENGLTRWRGTPLEALLPVTLQGGGGVREVEARLGERALRNPLFDPTAPDAPPREAWSGLPPLYAAPGAQAVKAHGEALLVSAGGGQPLLAYAPAGQGRVLLWAAGGLWKWDFLNPSLRPSGNIMPGWWRRAVQWMARPELETRLDVHPADAVVRRGEAVRFVARALDQSYRPLEDVAVQVEVTPADRPVGEPVAVALSGSEGFLSGAVGGLEPGRYRYRADARTPAEALGQVEGFFAVDSLGAELERLEADHELLKRLARATGAGFWNADSLDGLEASLTTLAAADEERRQVDLWDSPVLFALFVLFGSTEWLLRRRRGLI